MRRYLKYLFQLILSPGNGWEDIAIADDNPQSIASRGFYPLIAIAALSVFMQGVYHHAEFLVLFMRMIVTFPGLFRELLFRCVRAFAFAEPTLEKRYDEARSHTFVLYTTGPCSSDLADHKRIADHFGDAFLPAVLCGSDPVERGKLYGCEG